MSAVAAKSEQLISLRIGVSGSGSVIEDGGACEDKDTTTQVAISCLAMTITIAANATVRLIVVKSTNAPDQLSW